MPYRLVVQHGLMVIYSDVNAIRDTAILRNQVISRPSP
jgi:hypothetical protein